MTAGHLVLLLLMVSHSVLAIEFHALKCGRHAAAHSCNMM
jgi:hypothetical protein